MVNRLLEDSGLFGLLSKSDTHIDTYGLRWRHLYFDSLSEVYAPFETDSGATGASYSFFLMIH